MKIERNVPLSFYTTLRIGGPAAFFVRARAKGDIPKTCAFAQERNLPLLTLGGGSNVLIGDEGFSGIVLKNELAGVIFEECGSGVRVIAAAGVSWDRLVEETVRRGLFGIENLSGIPGTVGAAPVQNIGAYGAELQHVLEWVDVFDLEERAFKRLSNKECSFAYRDSLFKRAVGKRFIITHVCLRLREEGKPNVSYTDLMRYFGKKRVTVTLSSTRKAVLAIRAGKFPDLERAGTAGSFFKNPVVSANVVAELKLRFPDLPMYPVRDGCAKISLAWILEHICALKGVRRGCVGTYERHPLVFVSYSDATAKEMHAFAHYVMGRVHAETGLTIEPEVTFIP